MPISSTTCGPRPAAAHALGDARFKRWIAAALGHRVTPLPKGRPREAVEE
jgi:hypothetical protein